MCDQSVIFDRMTRVETLRKALGLTQAAFAAKLGVAQSTICGLEQSGRERGPVAMALDVVAREAGRPDLTAAAWASRGPETCTSEPSEASA